MNDEYLIKMLMAQLYGLVEGLSNLLDEDQALKFVGYQPEPVLAVDEKEVLANGRKTIDVTVLDQPKDRRVVLDFYHKFYANEGCSTRFVNRLPGVIVTSLPSEMVLELVGQINGLKDQIKTVVQKDRNHLQRHQFIHDAFPGIMTEQVYRHISCSQQQVRSTWFSWCSKRQVNQSFTPEDAIKWIAEQANKVKKPFSEEEWQAHIDATINNIQTNNYRMVQRQRSYRTFPVVDYSHYVEDKLKTNRFNAIMPWLLLDQPNNALPSGTRLRGFEQKSTTAHQELPHKAVSLFKPLRLIGVY